jgi:hypothetical protein
VIFASARARLTALTVPRAVALMVLAVIGIALTWRLFGPFFADLSAYGFADWDVHSAYRAMPVASLFTWHEGPWWNPWLCGGFPDWAYVEGATNVISPFAPLYALFPINVAVRLEVVGSTLLALVSAYLLASRFTKSVAVSGFVAIVWALNVRWALQATYGHTWHLQYAWLPLALFFFDVALVEKRLWFAVGSGAVLAMMVFMGGVYPLPHAALVLVLDAALLAAMSRSTRPLLALAITGVTALGLSAPKLLPVIDLSLQYPRLVESTESLSLAQLWTVLTNRHQGFEPPPISGLPWGWHEYGGYVGVVPVLFMVLTLVAVRGQREWALRAIALVFLVLGLGAFASWAPWTVLHRMPLFASQHVPSRFLFVAVLLLLVAGAAGVGKLVERVRWPWLDVVLLVPVLLVGLDVTAPGREWTAIPFYLHLPALTPGPAFEQRTTSPRYADERPARTLLGQTLPAMQANTGVLECYGVPTTNRGAIAADAEGYRGEAWVAEGSGQAHVLRWTPNTAVVEYRDATPGSLLVYNMNHDPSWRADGARAIEHHGAVATTLTATSGTVVFSYSPRALNAGVLVFGLTCLSLFIARRTARARPAASPTAPSGN